MASVITTGELQDVYWIPESTYGVTPASTAFTWGASLTEGKDDTDLQMDFQYLGGSRSYVAITSGPDKAGMTLKMIARTATGAYDWTKFFALNAFGAVGALTEHLPTFSMNFWVKQKDTSTYHRLLLNGCKIDTLKITAPDVGKPFEFEAKILAQVRPSYSQTLVFTGFQGVTIVDPSTLITTNPLTWGGICKYNLAGAGLVNFYPRKWTFEVNNNLEPWPANVQGNDGSYYSCCRSIEEKKREIKFSATIPHVDETWSNAKRAKSLMTQIQLPIDAKTMSLNTGYFTAKDFPTWKQDLNDDTIELLFQSLAIA